jgi:hypothetical protein
MNRMIVSRRMLPFATFLNLSQGIAKDGSFFLVQDRNVVFDYELDHELAKSTPHSQAAIVSIWPMARDNNRFFDDGEFGYGDLYHSSCYFGSGRRVR